MHRAISLSSTTLSCSSRVLSSMSLGRDGVRVEAEVGVGVGAD